MKYTVTILFVTTLLLFLFGYTGISKLMNLKGFRGTLMQMPLADKGAAVLAPVIPLAELVIVLLLLFPATRLKGLWGALLLLSGFTVYLVLLFLFAPHLPCSCGGVISSLSWEGHVGMNVGLVCATGVAIRSFRRMGDEL